MNVIFIMIGVSALIAVGFLISFIWATLNGQYEDDYTPSVRMLFEDAPPATDPEKPSEKPEKT